MNITILEPYCTGSHATWAEEYARYSRHRVDILSLPGRHWKWRMHGGAVTLARQFLASPAEPDLLLASDMLDLTTFLALTRRRTGRCRTALYCHENQLTYPWSPDDSDPRQQRDAHYGFINYASALAADAVLFNSAYHCRAFLEELPRFLKGFPDQNEPESVDTIAAKSRVLPLGLDLRRLDAFRPADAAEGSGGPPLILWNHRWEYDKNPEEFFSVLLQLADEGLAFQVAVLGECFARQPDIFKRARHRLGSRVVQWGYVEDFAAYAGWLWRAHILPVTSVHDFFGGSVVQALYCGCYPLLANRLAYPEHLPAGSHDPFLYEEGTLAARLGELLRKERGEWPGVEGVRDHVGRYDWGELAPAYDELLESITPGEPACR